MWQTKLYISYPLAGLGPKSRNGLCITSKKSDMGGDKALALTRLRRSRVQWWKEVSRLVASESSRSPRMVQGAMVRLLSYPRMAPRGGGLGGCGGFLAPGWPVGAAESSHALAWPGLEELRRTSPALGSTGDPGHQPLRPRKLPAGRHDNQGPGLSPTPW